MTTTVIPSANAAVPISEYSSRLADYSSIDRKPLKSLGSLLLPWPGHTSLSNPRELLLRELLELFIEK